MSCLTSLLLALVLVAALCAVAPYVMWGAAGHVDEGHRVLAPPSARERAHEAAWGVSMLFSTLSPFSMRAGATVVGQRGAQEQQRQQQQQPQPQSQSQHEQLPLVAVDAVSVSLRRPTATNKQGVPAPPQQWSVSRALDEQQAQAAAAMDAARALASLSSLSPAQLPPPPPPSALLAFGPLMPMARMMMYDRVRASDSPFERLGMFLPAPMLEFIIIEDDRAADCDNDDDSDDDGSDDVFCTRAVVPPEHINVTFVGRQLRIEQRASDGATSSTTSSVTVVRLPFVPGSMHLSMTAAADGSGGVDMCVHIEPAAADAFDDEQTPTHDDDGNDGGDNNNDNDNSNNSNNNDELGGGGGGGGGGAAADVGVSMLAAGDARRRDGEQETIMCPMFFRPMCGSDGRVYGNACLMRARNARLPHAPAVTRRCDGRCPCSGGDGDGDGDDHGDGDPRHVSVRRGDEQACPMYYMPMCASDGRTYGNTCEMNVANRARSLTGQPSAVRLCAGRCPCAATATAEPRHVRGSGGGGSSSSSSSGSGNGGDGDARQPMMPQWLP